MTVDAINGSNTQYASRSDQSSGKLSANFDTFLTLLTTQLQNQNPLDPMKADQFTQQLVQYSQVEQSIQTNQNLETLIAAQTAEGFSNMVGYLGKTVTMDTDAAGLKNGHAEWTYILGSDSQEARVVVRNKAGDAVFTQSLSGDALKKGEHTFTWDGIASDGTDMPEGGYSISISAKNGDSAVGTTLLVKGKVDSIETVAGQHWLVVNGVDVPLGTLKKVTDDPQDPAPENPQGA